MTTTKTPTRTATRKPTTPTRPATPQTTTRSRAADRLWRIRHSPWKTANLMATIAAAAIPALEYAATRTVTMNGALLAPYAAAPILAAIEPRARARATRDIKAAPTSARLRGMWNRWIRTDDGKALEYAAPFARRALTGQTRTRPRVVAVDRAPLRITLESPPFLTLAQWETQAETIGRHLGQRTPTVTLDKRTATATLNFSRLGSKIPPWSQPAAEGPVDLARLHVANGVDGPTYLRLLGNHVLITGATGAGKSGAFWSIVAALTPAIDDGTVQLWGIDPKGGLELGFGRDLFAEFAGDDDDEEMGDQILAILNAANATMRARKKQIAGHSRLWVPSPGAPLIVVLFDEFLALGTSIQNPRKRKAALAALTELMSQGRACAVTVIGASQIAQKSSLDSAIRDLFTVRWCLRVNDRVQVDMCLGDGMRGKGALAEEIGIDQPGTGYLLDDGRVPVFCRAPWTSDRQIQAMARAHPARNAPPATPLAVPPIPALDDPDDDPQDDLEGTEGETRADTQPLPVTPPPAKKTTPTPTRLDTIEALLDDEWDDPEAITARVAEIHGTCAGSYVRKRIAARRKAGLPIGPVGDGDGGGDLATRPGGVACHESGPARSPIQPVTPPCYSGSPSRDGVPTGEPTNTVKSQPFDALTSPDPYRPDRDTTGPF